MSTVGSNGGTKEVGRITLVCSLPVDAGVVPSGPFYSVDPSRWDSDSSCSSVGDRRPWLHAETKVRRSTVPEPRWVGVT